MKKLTIRAYIFITAIIMSSCYSNYKDISYDELLNLKSTHKIKDSNLEKSLHEVLIDSINYSKYDSPILVVISKKMSNNYELCISKTDYNIFKGNRPNTFNKLIGYSKLERIPVLLFGDNNSAIIKNEDADFYDVLGKMPEYGRDNPPMIFEPRMKCYEDKL